MVGRGGKGSRRRKKAKKKEERGKLKRTICQWETRFASGALGIWWGGGLNIRKLGT